MSRFVLGLKSPDVVLYDSLKLLCSLLVTLVGNGLYGAYSSSMENHFIDQGTDGCFSMWETLKTWAWMVFISPLWLLLLKILKNLR